MTIAPGITVPDEKLEEICRRHNIKLLSLFGSVARNQHRPNSNVDLLVEYLPGATRDFIRFHSTPRELSELIGRQVDLVPRDGLKERVRQEVVRDIRILYVA